MTKIERYNQSKTVRIATYFCTSLILLFVIVTFAQYYSLQLILTNSLVPKYLIQMAFETCIKKEIILLGGLLVVFGLTFNKKNVLAFLLSVILITYYIISNYHISDWNTQIN